MPAILFSHMDVPTSIEPEFNEWYDTEHVPSRMSVPGFQAAHRYRAIAGAAGDETPTVGYAIVYELADAAVVTTPTYQEMQQRTAPGTEAMVGRLHRFLRVIAEQRAVAGDDLGPTGHDHLLAVAAQVADDDVDEFAAWYDTEHVPLLLEEPAWRRCRRYDVTATNEAVTHLALHDLDTPAALDGAARARAVATPWRRFLEPRGWFRPENRWVYERITAVTA